MTREVTDLCRLVIQSNHDLSHKKKLLNEVRKLIPGDENRWNFRYVIWTLALVSLSVPVVTGILLYQHRGETGDTLQQALQLPQGLLALASAAVGALAGMLSPTAHRREAQPAGASDRTPPDSPLSEE